MRLKIAMSAATERLVALETAGYRILGEIRHDYSTKKQENGYNENVDNPAYQQTFTDWCQRVLGELEEIFPTELEAYEFCNPTQEIGLVSGDYEYHSFIKRFLDFIRGLSKIKENTSRYTDLPLQERLYVEHIDSFQKVRDVNWSTVLGFLTNGVLKKSENEIQLGLEQILGVSFHKVDWAGETNDLYTCNVIVHGARRATAFLLKGPGINKKQMTIGDCGANGDQLVRLFESPADLFVVQFVGSIADAVIKDVHGKVVERRAQGKSANYLVLDGQETARLLHAYGKL